MGAQAQTPLDGVKYRTTSSIESVLADLDHPKEELDKIKDTMVKALQLHGLLDGGAWQSLNKASIFGLKLLPKDGAVRKQSVCVVRTVKGKEFDSNGQALSRVNERDYLLLNGLANRNLLPVISRLLENGLQVKIGDETADFAPDLVGAFPQAVQADDLPVIGYQIDSVDYKKNNMPTFKRDLEERIVKFEVNSKSHPDVHGPKSEATLVTEVRSQEFIRALRDYGKIDSQLWNKIIGVARSAHGEEIGFATGALKMDPESPEKESKPDLLRWVYSPNGAMSLTFLDKSTLYLADPEFLNRI